MNNTDTSRRSATGAARSFAAAPGTRVVPHSPQKRSVGSFAAPHAGHDTERATPQVAQNLRPGLFSVPQFVQIIPPPVDGRAYRLHGSLAPRPCTDVVQDAAVSIEPRDAVERAWREQGAKLWRSLVAFTSDPDVATYAMAEAFAKSLGRGSSVRDQDRW